MPTDLNVLQKYASKYLEVGEFDEAIALFLEIAHSDKTLDAGYLAERIGFCYEQKRQFHVAKYWYDRAVEENPEIEAYKTAARRFTALTVDELVDVAHRRFD
jgi:tetratricopeptide (TPR) repeat protein